MFIKCLFGCIGIFLFLSIKAQSNYGGFFPETGITRSLTQNWSLKLKIESQHGMVRPIPGEADQIQYFHDRTDFQGFSAYTIRNEVKVAVGYQYRWQQGVDTHRVIEQISWGTSGAKKKIGHRIRTDQTFELDQPIQWRIRYRWAARYCFNGGSNYWLLSDEPIFSLQKCETSWENRLVFALGFVLPKGNRLQIGPDYRLDANFGESPRARLWLKVGWFSSF